MNLGPCTLGGVMECEVGGVGNDAGDGGRGNRVNRPVIGGDI
jgi:hypothetical protein